jgi:hypothetical protein
MSLVIRKEEIRFLQKRKKDNICRVFSWNERIFRGIFPKHEPFVRSLLSTGFLGQLVSQNYYPRTWITDYRMEDFSLIIEHERIWPVVYPQEWTFSMLKDAAILVLRIAPIAQNYGFNMKDCHGLNVLFEGISPKFIDLGSFIPDKCIGWRPYEEFLKFYYYRLNIWKHNSFLGKLSILPGNLTPHETYWQYQYPFLRFISPSRLNKFVRLCLTPEVLASCPFSDFQRESWSKMSLLYRLVKGRIIPARNMNLKRLIQAIEGIRQNKAGSPWGSYHERIKEKEKRFYRIFEIINNLKDDISSAADIAGNEGKFSRLLIQKTRVRKVVCIDYDEDAIDTGYDREKTVKTGNITFAHYDFMAPIVKLSWMLPSERFKADIAIALALTHHLILSQKYDINDVFRNVSAYAKKYVFIEFMPLGLWISGQEPNVPDWYTRDWFRQSFMNYFDLVLEEKIAKNNILFVGKIRSN